MSEQRPTPRTDAARIECALDSDLVEFARTLERELGETRDVLLATVERLEALDPTNPQAQRARGFLGKASR